MVTEIELVLPASLGALVVASEPVQDALRGSTSVRVTSIAPPPRTQAHNDFGATAITILGTAAAGAAVKGIVEIVKTAIVESHATRRQTAAFEHERCMLLLRTDLGEAPIDLDQELDEVMGVAEALLAETQEA